MKNWKTTLTGWGAAALYLFASALTTGMGPKDAAVAAGLGLLGTCAKDHNVTGGSVQQ